MKCQQSNAVKYGNPLFLFSRLLSITQKMRKTAAQPAAAAERENPNICWREETAVLEQKLSVGRIYSNNANMLAAITRNRSR